MPESLNTTGSGEAYIIEGIGYDFYPPVLARDEEHISSWVKTSDDESFVAAGRLMRSEGLMVGGSSGSVLAGTIKWFEESEEGRRIKETEGANVVILLADGYVLGFPRKKYAR